jgi:Recombination endonuclease VII.
MINEICTFDGCEIKARYKLYCSGHQSQFRRGAVLAPLQKRVRQRSTISNGISKVCSYCNTEKYLTEFTKLKGSTDGFSYGCKPCCNNRVRMWRYNVSADWYAVTLEYQGGVCAICKQLEPEKAFAVDHDHCCCPGDNSCGKCVRGLLCQLCNMSVERFEKPGWADNASAYLSRSSCNFAMA